MRARFAVGLGVVVLVALAWWSWSRARSYTPPRAQSVGAAPSKSSTAPASTMVSVSSVERDIIANGLTVERARLFFSLAFGPLPGVTLPSNVVRDQSLQDGNPAVDAIYLVWDQLTDEQRAAAAARMHTPTTPTGTARAAGSERVVEAGFTGGDTAAWDYGSMLESA